MMFFGLIFVVLVVLVIGGIAYILVGQTDFFDQFSNKSPSRRVENSSLDILKERYARGEIDEEEYLEKKENLK